MIHVSTQTLQLISSYSSKLKFIGRTIESRHPNSLLIGKSRILIQVPSSTRVF